jgi:hypothetical protein
MPKLRNFKGGVSVLGGQIRKSQHFVSRGFEPPTFLSLRAFMRAISRRRKIMNRRETLSLATMTLLSVALPQVGLAQTNQPTGTWKLNLAKSKFSPGPPPRSQTLTYETVGQGFKATNEGIDAQGNPTKGVFGVYFYDGKSYPITGVPDFDASSYKAVNESTVEMTRTKAGKAVQTQTRVMSADGKALTFTATGTNAKGQQINNIAVYEKQ